MYKNQKGFGLVEALCLVIIIVGVCVISYRLYHRRSENSVSNSPVSRHISDICSELKDATFVPLDKSKATNVNVLKFQNNAAEWHYSDVVVSGNYECSNNQIELKLRNDSHRYDVDRTAYYSVAKQLLNFESIDYILQEK